MPDYWKIDDELMGRLCKIAKLGLGEGDRKKYMKQLSAVLDTFRVIETIDAKEKQPAFHPVKVENVWREDSVEETSWNPLGNARETENGFIKGPRIV